MPEPIPNPTLAPAPTAAAPNSPPIHAMPAPGSTQHSGSQDPFDDDDFVSGAKQAVDGTPPPTPKPSEPAPAAPPAGEKPSAKPATPTAPSKPQGGPKELREELDRVRAERDSFKQRQTDIEAKIAAAEAKGKNTDVLTERLAALEKTIAEREADIRALKQEASPEFKEKYEKPFNEAAEYARSRIEKMKVFFDDGLGNKTQRPATWADFVKLYNLDDGDAMELAAEMFSPIAAQAVVNHLTELHRLDAVRGNALKSERANAAARMKDEEARRVQSQETASTALSKINAELPNMYEAYRDPPEDKECAEARAAAYAKFDEVPQSPQQAMLKFAHVRQKVAAHKPLVIQLGRAKAEIERLKAELAGKTTTEPSPGKRPGGTTVPSGESDPWESGRVPSELANIV